MIQAGIRHWNAYWLRIRPWTSEIQASRRCCVACVFSTQDKLTWPRRQNAVSKHTGAVTMSPENHINMDRAVMI